MLVEAKVEGFKRLKSHTFRFHPLTVLAGLNGSGKTSLVQSLLLAREASNSSAHSIRLNGPFGLELGIAEKVLNWNSEPPIRISLESGHGRSIWEFGVPEGEALFLDVTRRPEQSPLAFSQKPRAFTYLDAERIGPRSVFQTAALPDDELEVGARGEHCAHVLSVLGDKVSSHPDRSHPSYSKPDARLLKYEVEAWLSEIARPIEVKGERFGSSTVAELSFRSPGGEWVLATNMGFGLSYALPVILGGLIAETDGLFIVENPEAHLHPSGQSRMGVFLAWLASRGIQVLIETHSDHVLNGIRRAVAEHNYLPHKDVIIHYFSPDEPTGEPGQIEAITIKESGNLSAWPAQFFDQYQIDVSSLGRVWRRT
jgi:predicted ATPase